MQSRWAKRLPSQSRARDTFDVIIEAAHQLLSQDRDVNVGTIAERAGVGVGSVYRYFGDKRAVLGELGERLLKANISQTEAHFGVALQRRDRPIRLVRRYLDGAARRRKGVVVRRLLRMASDGGYRAGFAAYLANVDAVLQKALADHPDLHAPPHGLSLLVRAVPAALEYAAEQTDWLDHPETFKRTVDELTIMVYAYLTADRDALLARMAEAPRAHAKADA